MLDKSLNYLIPYKLEDLTRLGNNRDAGYVVPISTLKNCNFMVSFGMAENFSMERDFLQSEGADRYLDKAHIVGHRGLITDRRGDVLALSTPVDSITANPRVLRFDNPTLGLLAESLNLQTHELRQKLARYSKKRFVYLKNKLPPSEARHILNVAKSNGLNGLSLERSYKRYYPAGEIFSHVIGFANHKDKGQEGIELAYDHELSGSAGSKLVLRDGRRRAVDDIENIKSPQNGKNLALSIDGRLQYIAYRELKAAVKRNQAIGGSAVVLDVQTGEILAMVNQPGFNPNGDRSSKNGRIRNRSLTDVFEPGSTMKPFAIAAAMELKAITSKSIIDTGSGTLQIAGKIIQDKNLDILFYTDIHMSTNLYFLTLYKLAKYQITTLGHPETTGNNKIDYFKIRKEYNQN